jgi:hypothetical protein
MRSRIRELAISAVLVLMATSLVGPPMGHDVHTPGASVVAGVQIADVFTHVKVVPIRPSTSLADVRCQAWQATENTVCPDATNLSVAFWPELKPSTKTLYVGLSTDCFHYTFSYGFNVEYLAENRRLTIHCYSTAPWIPWSSSVSCRDDCASLPVTTLAVVPTDNISPGPLTVIRDDRIEHFIGDQSTEVSLGTLTVS